MWVALPQARGGCLESHEEIGSNTVWFVFVDFEEGLYPAQERRYEERPASEPECFEEKQRPEEAHLEREEAQGL